MIESAALTAELIPRYAIFEDVYLQSASRATDELRRALVKLYAAILIYLSKAKSYFEQRSASQSSVFNGGKAADEINRSYHKQCTLVRVRS